MEIISHTLPRSAHRITTDDTVICRTFPKRRSLNTARSFDRQYCNTSMPLSLGSSSSSSPSVKRTESTKYSDGLFRGCFSKLNRRNIVTRNQQPVSKNIYKGWSFYHCKEIIIIIFCYLGFHIIGFFYVLICIGLDCLCCILWVPPPPIALRSALSLNLTSNNDDLRLSVACSQYFLAWPGGPILWQTVDKLWTIRTRIFDVILQSSCK